MQRLGAIMQGSRARLALASGVALTAYVAHQTHTIQAAEPVDHIFVINGCASRSH